LVVVPIFETARATPGPPPNVVLAGVTGPVVEVGRSPIEANAAPLAAEPQRVELERAAGVDLFVQALRVSARRVVV
jgi:hypothetical protein